MPLAPQTPEAIGYSSPAELIVQMLQYGLHIEPWATPASESHRDDVDRPRWVSGHTVGCITGEGAELRGPKSFRLDGIKAYLDKCTILI